MAVNSNQNSESDVKNKAENILRELGVPVSTAIDSPEFNSSASKKQRVTLIP